jgi:hypothetical protein
VITDEQIDRIVDTLAKAANSTGVTG